MKRVPLIITLLVATIFYACDKDEEEDIAPITERDKFTCDCLTPDMIEPWNYMDTSMIFMDMIGFCPDSSRTRRNREYNCPNLFLNMGNVSISID